ncbi:hypothetical protein J4467_03885 [Candidatus Woesearchaeota archaeon]|nr:hypothetical protein [Candidatus Woesearchaeota archaeon]
MEAIGKIYSPFGIRAEERGVLEAFLSGAKFRLWTTTEFPNRTMISFGARDSLDNERCLQGYIERETNGGLTRCLVYATGRNLISYMDNLSLD